MTEALPFVAYALGAAVTYVIAFRRLLAWQMSYESNDITVALIAALLALAAFVAVAWPLAAVANAVHSIVVPEERKR